MVLGEFNAKISEIFSPLFFKAIENLLIRESSDVLFLPKMVLWLERF